jgi:hypothetical protein
MQLFDFPEAQYFCRPLPAHVPGVGQSLASFHKNLSSRRLREPSQDFEIHRVSMLNSIERWILFGAAHYRRALDMYVPSSAPWAQVTLYYSSFFAANAILGMFGAWIHLQKWVDVESGVAGNQILRINANPRSPNGYQGSHQRFWDFFYEGCNTISPWVPNQFGPAIIPVNNDRRWQIISRNEINYDTAAAFDLATVFQTNFNPKKLRSYGGPLGQQLELTEGLLKLAIHFANNFNIASFPFEGLATGTRSKALRALVTKAPPGLTTQSILQDLFVS